MFVFLHVNILCTHFFMFVGVFRHLLTYSFHNFCIVISLYLCFSLLFLSFRLSLFVSFVVYVPFVFRFLFLCLSFLFVFFIYFCFSFLSVFMYFFLSLSLSTFFFLSSSFSVSFSSAFFTSFSFPLSCCFSLSLPLHVSLSLFLFFFFLVISLSLFPFWNKEELCAPFGADSPCLAPCSKCSFHLLCASPLRPGSGNRNAICF